MTEQSFTTEYTEEVRFSPLFVEAAKHYIDFINIPRHSTSPHFYQYYRKAIQGNSALESAFNDDQRNLVQILDAVADVVFEGN